jgi:carbon monoxide dehydrogenase subunit G
MMTLHSNRPGGRHTVRRFAFMLVGAYLAVAAPARTTAMEESQTHAAVTVSEAGGVYSVTARFEVRQPLAVARAVLTDYERIPQFMPGVETSVVIERVDGRAVIEQEAVSRLMMFRKRVHLVLEIVERADSLQFRDRSGQSFVRYEGKWTLCHEDGGTRISYDLTAQPAFDVPEFVLKRVLKRDSGQMIEGLRREIDSRGRLDRARP